MNYPYTKIKCSATSYVNPIDKGKKPINRSPRLAIPTNHHPPTTHRKATHKPV